MGGVAQEVGGACFVEGPPVLGSFDFKNFVFQAFVCADFFFSERAFAIVTQSGLAPTGRCSFLRKSGKTVGILALGPDRRGLCFHPEISWCSRSAKARESFGKYV